LDARGLQNILTLEIRKARFKCSRGNSTYPLYSESFFFNYLIELKTAPKF
jgi:hypothetical protein